MNQLLILYSLVAAGLIASLALFWSLKRDLQAQARRNRKQLEQLARATEAPAPEPEPVYLAPPPRAGLNISKRVHAMRMVRRNQDVSHIAAALGVTRREVELLIRVNTMKPQI
jgi:predicted component of type VI protein secretion system